MASEYQPIKRDLSIKLSGKMKKQSGLNREKNLCWDGQNKNLITGSLYYS